jgi:hypothetical protein
MLAAVPNWNDFARDAPEFADRVRRLFDARKHKTMATLRADGSPRISGIELRFAGGEVRFGSMPDSVKGRDLERDPRMAVHSPSVDPPAEQSEWPGEAKISGRAVRDDEGYRIDIAEVALTRLGTPADHLVIESWHPGRGWERRTRA